VAVVMVSLDANSHCCNQTRPAQQLTQPWGLWRARLSLSLQLSSN
jgi:hypothetical protein